MENQEELLQALESVANFMRGMQFDPRLPVDMKSALIDKAMEVDDLVEKHLSD